MLAVIALNELHESRRTGSHHARQFVACDCGPQACQKFFLRGRQTGTPAAPQQRSDCRPLQAADGQIQRADEKGAAEIKSPLACPTHAGCQGTARCLGKLIPPPFLFQSRKNRCGCRKSPPGLLSWPEATLLGNDNREIKRAGSVIALPAHAISIKNKYLLLACATNPRFHGGCFGV